MVAGAVGALFQRVSAVGVWAGLVYLVEEDIFVAADFFAFHRAVQGGAVAGLGPTVDAEHWALVHSVMAHNLDVRSRHPQCLCATSWLPLGSCFVCTSRS